MSFFYHHYPFHEILDEIVDPNSAIHQVDDHLDQKQAMAQVRRVWHKLGSIERQILEQRFGLRDGHEINYNEIGDIMGLTRKQVTKLESQAINRLRHFLEPADATLYAQRSFLKVLFGE